MNHLIKIFTAGLSILLVILVLELKPVLAEEITISDNGDSSQNTVSVTANTTTNVEQSNNAQVTNTVTPTADTGNNQASDNSGSAAITTGSATEKSTIENSANSSQVTSGCCSSPTPQVTISGNGSDSNNSVTATQTNQTEVTVSQTANIANTTDGQANTGDNQANSNEGSASISTGNINAVDNTQNRDINLSNVTVPQGGSGNWSTNISSNGSGSTNSISIDQTQHNNIAVNNEATIENNNHWDLNTGENFANGNLGDVAITTGHIDFSSTLENDSINVSEVALICCTATPDPSPSPTTPTSNPLLTSTPDPGGDGGSPSGNSETSSGSSGSSGGTGGPSDPGGEVLGASAGEELAATGNDWLIVLTLLGLLTLSGGLYLRFSSPPKVSIKHLKLAL